MGSIFAQNLAHSGLPLRAAIEAHLRYNHYPPLPYCLIETCVEIIERYKRGETDEPVKLPGGVTWRDQNEAPFWSCVEGWHLQAFLEN